MNYLDIIEKNKEEMIKTLQELIAIPSVQGKPELGAPFGLPVDEALEYMLKKGLDEGFSVENVDHFGGHIDFGGHFIGENGEITGASDEVMGILGHLDVVPEGSGWDWEPFGGEIADERIYGRGAIDDKGPVVAAFYAMKALKEAGIEPEAKVRLILGLDEETGWKGMEYYLKKVKAPDFGFTPDADFPVIHGEMGMLVFELAKKLTKSASKKGLALRSVTGGNAPNMVPDSCRAVIRGESYEDVKAKARIFENQTGYKIGTKGRGKSLELSTAGISAHGAQPEKGRNAISIMMQFLSEIGLENEDVRDFLDFYNRHIGFELDGSSLGCGFSDELSGRLILNVGLVSIDDEAVRLGVNIRYPISANEEQVYEGIMSVVAPFGIGIVKHAHKAPVFIPVEDERVRIMVEAYQEFSGDTESKPQVIGGGTYAKAMQNIVAFGAMYPGMPSVEHQKNEYIEIDKLVETCKIYARAIERLARGKSKI